MTVKGVISREVFKHARVLAGEGGLNREVKWTHILETEEFDSLINGGELILTTGVGLQLDLSSESTYKRLIEKDAAGICIELGYYFNNISPNIKRLADECNFPIIVFEKKVKFVEITQDLHTLIINQHHQALYQLSELTKKFTELSLSPNGLLKILQELHSYFGLSVLFVTDETESYYYPPGTKHYEMMVRSHLKKYRTGSLRQSIISVNDESFALTPVIGLGKVWGFLCLHVKVSPTDKIFFSILDRAAMSLAQILLRNRTIEERKLNKEDEVVRNLIEGKDYDSNDLHAFLPFTKNNFYYRILLIQTNVLDIEIREEEWEEIKVQRSMLIRSLVKSAGCFSAVSVKKNEVAVICSFLTENNVEKDMNNFSEIIKSIFEMNHKIIDGVNCTVGVSGVHKKISSASLGYEEAREVLQLQEAKVSEVLFYENTGIYRLLLQLHKNKQLEAYVNDWIGVLIDYDREMKSDLLKTLEVYLQCRGAKKETANQLFIVRQTLYHRLEKIKQLLGEDFLESTNRLAIEVAIKSYHLLKS